MAKIQFNRKGFLTVTNEAKAASGKYVSDKKKDKLSNERNWRYI